MCVGSGGVVGDRSCLLLSRLCVGVGGCSGGRTRTFCECQRHTHTHRLLLTAFVAFVAVSGTFGSWTCVGCAELDWRGHTGDNSSSSSSSGSLLANQESFHPLACVRVDDMFESEYYMRSDCSNLFASSKVYMPASLCTLD